MFVGWTDPSKDISNKMKSLSSQRPDWAVAVHVLSFCCVLMLLRYLLVVALSVYRCYSFCLLKVPFRVHSVLEKSLKMFEFGIKNFKALESAWKQIRCLKVLEKSLNLNLANFEILHLLTILKQYFNMDYKKLMTAICHLFLSLRYWWVQYSTLQCHIAV